MMLYHDDCRDVMPKLQAGSVDSVISDVPYPGIIRDYGHWTEDEWMSMMQDVVRCVRRLLKPTGSAVFVMQPTSSRIGQLRPWVWRFMAWLSSEWNVIQDVWWWNHAATPTTHSSRKYGLMRPSVKLCAWFGEPDCARFQERVLWTESEASKAVNLSDRALKISPSGQTVRAGRTAAVARERGGSTPFNLLPIANTNSVSSGGAKGHGAATPLALCRWWVRYLTPPGGIVLDPFMGSGTVGVAALEDGADFIGIERDARCYAIASQVLRSLPAAQMRLA